MTNLFYGIILLAVGVALTWVLIKSKKPKEDPKLGELRERQRKELAEMHARRVKANEEFQLKLDKLAKTRGTSVLSDRDLLKRLERIRSRHQR